MRISSVLFHCIKNELGFIVFPIIDMYSVRSKRQWENYSPEKRAIVCQKMSKSAISSPNNEKKKILMSEGMKRYWDTISKSNKKIHTDEMSKGMKKAWDESDETFKSRLSNPFYKKRIHIEHDVPRINTYSGVITESQMEEINA